MANGFVSLNGISNDGQFAVRLTVVFEGNKWQAGEPGGTSNVFATKSGVWMRAVNIVTLFADNAQTRIGQLNPLVPETAVPGNSGQGHNFETAVDFGWTVLAEEKAYK